MAAMSAIVAERGENDELEYRVAWLDGNSWHTQWLPVAEVLHVASLCSIFDSAWGSYLLGRVTPEASEVLQIDRNAAAKADVVRMALAEGLTLVHAPNPAGFLWVSWRRGAAFCKKPYEVQMWKGDGKRGGRNLSTAGGYFATSWEAGLAVARHLGPERSAQMAASCMLENGRRAPTQRQVEHLSALREKRAAKFAAKKAQKAAEKAKKALEPRRVRCSLCGELKPRATGIFKKLNRGKHHICPKRAQDAATALMQITGQQVASSSNATTHGNAMVAGPAVAG